MMKKSDITILVADDDPDHLFQILFSLEKARYRAMTVESQTPVYCDGLIHSLKINAI